MIDIEEAAIRADERAKTLDEAFAAISFRLGIAGDQTARMICLGALKSIAPELTEVPRADRV